MLRERIYVIDAKSTPLDWKFGFLINLTVFYLKEEWWILSISGLFITLFQCLLPYDIRKNQLQKSTHIPNLLFKHSLGIIGQFCF